MKWNACAVFALALMLAAHLSTGARATPDSLRDQYKSIMKEFNRVGSDLRDASTDLQRKTSVEQMATISSKLIDLAAKSPQDPIALTALRQAVQAVGSTDSAALTAWETNRSNFPSGNSEESASKIVALVLRDHLQSPKLGPIIDRMRYGYRFEFEACLIHILNKSPHRTVRGLACLALAQNLNDRSHMLHLVNERPALSTCYNIVFGKDYLPQLRQLGRNNLDNRIEKLFDRATKEFADIKFRTSTVGDVAKAELYERRHLSVGKTAPDIQGKDQNGKSFKLSDYRGKVVLIYFWSEY